MTTRVKIINKPTWRWQYCNQSGWSFQIGEPHLELHMVINRFNRNTAKVKKYYAHGELTVHVFYAKWWITGSDFIECSFDNDEDHIQKVMARMDGMELISLTFHDDGWVTNMHFDTGVEIKVLGYDNSGIDNICNLLTNDAQQNNSKVGAGQASSVDQ